MPKTRPVPIDRSLPRYNIRLSKGRGQLIGSGWSEPYARRLASQLAEQYGEPVVLLDCWTRRRIRGYQPSREAVAREKQRIEAASKRVTASGYDGSMFDVIYRRRPKEPAPLSDRAECPENLPLRPVLPGDVLL